MRNAAIWYAPDGYDPQKHGMNGRRVAGQSFLRGFLKHAEVDHFACVATSPSGVDEFAKIVEAFGRGKPADGWTLTNLAKTAEIGTVFYPSPTLSAEAWRRFHATQASFSLCGITHTTATKAVMESVMGLRMAPIEPWDAVICTSQAVLSSLLCQLDHVDAYIERRFGYAPPPRPMLPVIPLGINQDEFDIPEDKGKALRQRIGISTDTRVALILCRLTANEKFDPLPCYLAMQRAQKIYGGKMALILCGYFSDESNEKIFRDGAADLMPDVEMHVVNGRNEDDKHAAFSAADMFLFPIDNLQETFGIAPIEAMAAGLPLVVSDWDGMKDTVSPDVGFRIPTIMAGRDNSVNESFRYLTGMDGYQSYLMQTAAATTIDVEAMADKIALLAADKNLAKRMGKAGRDRVRHHYDWSAIIRPMQDLWQEQTRIRQHATQDAARRYRGISCPIAPPPTEFFASYPTRSGLQDNDRFELVDADIKTATEQLRRIVNLRKNPYLSRDFKLYATLLGRIGKATGPIPFRALADGSTHERRQLEKRVLLLSKYHVIRKV